MPALTEKLLATLGHNPTEGQRRAANALARLLETDKPQATLILKGYAGTGKTTLIGALVKVLAAERRSVVLLAPTGRAAKVLSAFAGAGASTIHRRIYRTGGDDDGGYAGIAVAPNRDNNALFVVDEASMIGASGGGTFDRDLLADLFQHVFANPGNKLLLIGDPAQLPPVGSAHSPALEVKDLAAMGLLAGAVEMTEVVRQAEASGILVNATALRDTLARMPETDPLPEVFSKKEPAKPTVIPGIHRRLRGRGAHRRLRPARRAGRSLRTQRRRGSVPDLPQQQARLPVQHAGARAHPRLRGRTGSQRPPHGGEEQLLLGRARNQRRQKQLRPDRQRRASNRAPRPPNRRALRPALRRHHNRLVGRPRRPRTGSEGDPRRAGRRRPCIARTAHAPIDARGARQHRGPHQKRTLPTLPERPVRQRPTSEIRLRRNLP
ncbi:MAG: AAA family ATPase [Flavobacteriales bacterium]|nr:AAA family ATPase [Flavobacteriales bacterium]